MEDNELKMIATMDDSDIKKKSKEINKSISEIFKELNTPYRGKKFDSIIKNYGDLEKVISLLDKKLESLQKKKINAIISGGATRQISNQITNTKKIVDSLKSVSKEIAPTQGIIKSQIKPKLGKPISSGLGGTVGQSTQEINKNTKAVEENGKAVVKSTSRWKIFLGRIKNISIYRAIRTGLKWITSGFREGLNNLVQFDEKSNDTMSNLNASLNQIKNTMGIALASVLQALEPVLSSLADSVVKIVDAFNLAMAKATGKDYYVTAKKNVEDYAKSLKKAQKFSFDTFETLSGGGESSAEEKFDKIDLDDAEETALSNTFTKILEIVKELWERIQQIFNKLNDSKLIENLLNLVEQIVDAVGDLLIKLIDSGVFDIIINAIGIILDGISDLIDYTVKSGLLETIMQIVGTLLDLLEPLFEIAKLILEVLDPVLHSLLEWLGGILEQIGGALKIISGIIKLLTGDFEGAFKDIGDGFKKLINGMGRMFVGFINLIIDGINLLLKPLNLIGKLFGAGEGFAQIPHIKFTGIQGFADGGFTTANFIATNENGKREWVGRNAGATAVVNDTQMSDIMYGAVRQGCYEGILQAMYESPSGGSNDGREFVLKVDANVLGRVVAESVGFRNEVNRRNTNLNLR